MLISVQVASNCFKHYLKTFIFYPVHGGTLSKKSTQVLQTLSLSHRLIQLYFLSTMGEKKTMTIMTVNTFLAISFSVVSTISTPLLYYNTT